MTPINVFFLQTWDLNPSLIKSDGIISNQTPKEAVQHDFSFLCGEFADFLEFLTFFSMTQKWRGITNNDYAEIPTPHYLHLGSCTKSKLWLKTDSGDPNTKKSFVFVPTFLVIKIQISLKVLSKPKAEFSLLTIRLCYFNSSKVCANIRVITLLNNISFRLSIVDATAISKIHRPTIQLVYVHTKPEDLKYRAANSQQHYESGSCDCLQTMYRLQFL